MIEVKDVNSVGSIYIEMAEVKSWTSLDILYLKAKSHNAVFLSLPTFNSHIPLSYRQIKSIVYISRLAEQFRILFEQLSAYSRRVECGLNMERFKPYRVDAIIFKALGYSDNFKSMDMYILPDGNILCGIYTRNAPYKEIALVIPDLEQMIPLPDEIRYPSEVHTDINLFFNSVKNTIVDSFSSYNIIKY